VSNAGTGSFADTDKPNGLAVARALSLKVWRSWSWHDVVASKIYLRSYTNH
jgi:hypothetical protein